MCLAVPGKVATINGSFATVDIAGNHVETDIAMVPEVKVGDYVLVHAGFAIQIYDRQEALQTLKLFEELASSHGDISK